MCSVSGVVIVGFEDVMAIKTLNRKAFLDSKDFIRGIESSTRLLTVIKLKTLINKQRRALKCVPNWSATTRSLAELSLVATICNLNFTALKQNQFPARPDAIFTSDASVAGVLKHDSQSVVYASRTFCERASSALVLKETGKIFWDDVNFVIFTTNKSLIYFFGLNRAVPRMCM